MSMEGSAFTCGLAFAWPERQIAVFKSFLRIYGSQGGRQRDFRTAVNEAGSEIFRWRQAENNLSSIHYAVCQAT